MKQTLTSLFLLFTIATVAQPKVISQAVITTKTTITTPEGMEDVVPSPPPSANGEEIRRTVRFGGDGETKSVTTLKGDMVKTFTETEMNRTTVLRDNNKKVTTTLMEMMGSKTGFYVTDEEMKVRARQMDSLMQSRRQANNNNFNTNAAVSSTIIYADETKKIAGIICKKAYLVITRKNDSKDSFMVWYCPDFKLQGLSTTGGMSGGFGGFGRTSTTSLSSLDSLAGFPMQYQMKLNRGSIMTIEVTKINIEKEVADKEFEIPKDFVVKPMKDLQGGGDGRMMIRMGGPGGGGN